eukprot:Hpha_TRINITY_DN335_c0_g1::TRINITY_DN335_c0_g1_i1::g.112590::m.112590
MMRLGAVFSLAAAVCADVPIHAPRPGAAVHPDWFIARLKNVPESRVSQLFKDFPKSNGRRVKFRGAADNGFVIVKLTRSELAAFRNREEDAVEWIEPDVRGRVSNTDPVPCPTEASGSIYGLRRTTSATLPSSEFRYAAEWGSGVDAYILDTGVWCDHTEFSARCTWGPNYVSDSPDVDEHGHGTHIAGTIGGLTYGVAKAVNIISVKVLDSTGSGWYSDFMLGLQWVIDQTVITGRRSVINFSIGGGLSDALDNAIAAAVAANIGVGVSAGNNNVDACEQTPARESTAVTVGSFDSTDTKSSWSNWGPCVDIWAAGSGIESASVSCDTCSTWWSGTSMATPHVVGVMAATLSVHPTMSSTVLKQRILDTSVAGVLGLDQTSPDRILQINCL